MSRKTEETLICCVVYSSTPLKHREVSFGWELQGKSCRLSKLQNSGRSLSPSSLKTTTCIRHKFKSISHDMTGLLRVWLLPQFVRLIVKKLTLFYALLPIPSDCNAPVLDCVRYRCRDRSKMASHYQIFIEKRTLNLKPCCTEMMGVRGLNWK